MIAAHALSFTHPGDVGGFSDVSFSLPRGAHGALIGTNGVGKTTIMRILAGELEPDGGTADLGSGVRFMPQEVGFGPDERELTVRALLGRFAPSPLDVVDAEIRDADRRLAAGDDQAGIDLGEAYARWGDLGGYEIEARWDTTCRQVLGEGIDAVGERAATSLSGGERKRLVLGVLLDMPGIDVLLLDEPDNYLDVPAKRALEEAIIASPQTILMISHDRELLARAPQRIITLEPGCAWVHHGTYATYEDARQARQDKLGDERERWHEEERRLYRYFKLLKERARYSDTFAKKADAAESRWERFSRGGPPPAPVADQQVAVRLRGAGSGRRMLALHGLHVDGLLAPISVEVHHGERIAVTGPNGTGKTHLVRALAGQLPTHGGTVDLGARVAVGYFAQVNEQPAWEGHAPLSIITEQTGNDQRAMNALARYGLAGAATRPYETLSGGQKARLAILVLELSGVNLLLLDEPTDNLDIDSSRALEQALDSFDGAVLSVSHDRAHLATFDTWWHVDAEGTTWALSDLDAAVRALTDGLDAVPDRARTRLSD